MYRLEGKLTKNRELEIDSNLKFYQIDEWLVYSNDEIYSTKDDIFEIVKHYHCIAIRQKGNLIEVINDPFSSIPVFIYCKDNVLILNSVFENFKGLRLTIDRAGCYELLMYEAGLFDRTVFAEIKQMPAASIATYNLDTYELFVESYWDYKIENIPEVSKSDAVDRVWEVLSNTYRTYKDKDILMGMSGGLDSRLSLCLLKNVSNANSISTFTFGHSRSIKDYKYASMICEQLSVDKPKFFKLTDEAYREGLRLPAKTGGCIGVAHGHAWFCLNHLNLDGKTLVSNYYSDGVMGYDCRPTDTNNIDDCDYYEILKTNRWNAPADVLDQIREDFNKVSERRAKEDNFSGYNEYIYLTERNPKFHMVLSYLYSEILPVETPFASFDLLMNVISLPKEIRYYKKIEHLILSEKLGKFTDISSTRYAGWDQEETRLTEKMRYNSGFIGMLVLNRINAGLKFLSDGVLQIPNPYITENHLAVFDRCFFSEKRLADNALKEWLGMDISDNPLMHKNYRTANAEDGFKLVGMYRLLNEYLGR